MSDLYQLALGLREAENASIARLVHERSLSLADFRDFFDLAQAILNPKSIGLLAATISTSQLAAARSLQQGRTLSDDAAQPLIDNFFAFRADSGDMRLFDWLIERLASRRSLLQEAKPIADSVATIELERDCAMAAFETMQAITELIFDADQNYIREVGRAALGLPDAKRLANHLGKPKEYVRVVFDLAKLAGLVTASNGRIVATRAAEAWMTTSSSRWQLLATSWLSLIPLGSQQEAAATIAQHPKLSLESLIAIIFPLATELQSPIPARILELAQLIGLSSAGACAPWLRQVLDGDVQGAQKAIGSLLPQPQTRALIQGEGLIVAPGPLSAELEIELRKFATTESIGLASSYRLSAHSITLGLEEGLTEAEIRSLLYSLTEISLPQPVDYLIRETTQRFGRISIYSLERGSKIVISDELLAKQIALDSKLKPLLIETRGADLVSALTDVELYHGLRQAGYLAIRVADDGAVVAPSSNHQDSTQALGTSEQIARLREKDFALDQQSPVSDLERKIQLALKSRSSVNVEVDSQGRKLSFVLEPIGLANGRLRARDRRADIERTLPLAAITSITIG